VKKAIHHILVVQVDLATLQEALDRSTQMAGAAAAVVDGVHLVVLVAPGSAVVLLVVVEELSS
jgi:hypothetical protein